MGLWLLAATSATFSALWAIRLFNVQPPFIDFLPLWTAGRFAIGNGDRVYDFNAVSQAQVWLLQTVPTPRPFVYPPTALLWLAPLGRLPFWIAAAVWSLAGAALFGLATWKLADRRQAAAVGLALVSPTTVIALIAGQSDLVSGGLVLLAVRALGRRPRLCGALLALAASLKPQMVLLAPVAWLAAGAYEALASAALVFLALAAVSVAGFGVARWTEWLGALAPFQAVVARTPGLASFSLSPIELAQSLGLPKPGVLAGELALGLLALAVVWFGFRRGSASDPERCGLLLGAGLLASPYALAYDGAPLVPPAVALAVLANEPNGLARLAPLAAAIAMALPWTGPWDLLAFVALLIWRVASPQRGTAAGSGS